MPLSSWLERSATGEAEREFISTAELKRLLRAKVYAEIDPSELLAELERDSQGVRRELSELVERIVADEGYLITEDTKSEMQEYILHEVLGLGPIEPLLQDRSIEEVMVNKYNEVWVARRTVAGGVELELTDVRFDDDDHVRHVIDRILGPIGRRVDEASPRVDARLPDGSRVNVIIPPLAIDGPTITIRKFPEKFLTMDDLVGKFATLTPEVAQFLETCVAGRLNVIISGGTGSGKTTLLNALTKYVPDKERIVTIEDTAELQVHRYKPHVVRLEARPPNVEGKGAVPIRDLVVNALRMRPDRIVVGECRAGETVDMLQAMNTGHDGSLTTVHANSPQEALIRIENMFLMSGMEVPVSAIRELTSMAIQLIVQLRRLPDGSRRVTNVTEIVGMDGDNVETQNLYVLQDGKLVSTGSKLTHVPKLRLNLTSLPPMAVFASGDGEGTS
ncbi:MAG: CpaF family protein [Ardenticatenia bacterium]|nr:CpaF family protein [Ardenticatenia bacterium]